MKIDVSVIISTYNQPEWLKKVLWSCELQTVKGFEVIIADDGSNEETKQLIEDFKKRVKFKINHIWHDDNGFQKTIILNKAINNTNADYLIFTDGDCILRNDFIATHLRYREAGHALSGGYFKLNEAISHSITQRDIETQICFKKPWLLEHGQPTSFKMNKLTESHFKAVFLNAVTPTKATFDGMNASVWKKDILEVNGFDERMQYGGEDRELGERLMNKGITFKQIRYSAVCLHLFHERPYKNIEAIEKNNLIRKYTKQSKSVFTPFGIEKQITLG